MRRCARLRTGLRAGLFGCGGGIAPAALVAGVVVLCGLMTAGSVAGSAIVGGVGVGVVDEPAAGSGESESLVMRRTIERRLVTTRRSVEAYERALARLERGDDAREVRTELAREVAPELSRALHDRAGGGGVGGARGGDDRERDRGRWPGRVGGPGGAVGPVKGDGVGSGETSPESASDTSRQASASSSSSKPQRSGGGVAGDAGEGVDGGSVTVEEREIIFRILIATVPPLETQLREMCEQYPERCADQMVNLRDRFSSLIRDAREDSALFDLRLEEIRVARERFLIAREIVAFERAIEQKSDALVSRKLEQSRRHHRDLIAEQFHLRNQIRDHELSQVEARIAELAEKKARLQHDIETDRRGRDEIIAEQEAKSLDEIRRRMPAAGGGAGERGGPGGAGQPMRRGGRGGQG